MQAPVVSRGLGGSETVLVVEDQAQVLRVVKGILKRAGFQVLEAGSGEEALKVAEAFSGKIDLLLTDVVLPGLAGPQVAAALAAARPGVRVLFMSGYTDNSIVHHGVLESGINFLEKPLTVDSLTRKIRAVLDLPK